MKKRYKQLIALTLALAVSAMGLTACSESEPRCPKGVKDPAAAMTRAQDKIDDLESEIDGQKGGKVRNTQDQIDELKSEIADLKACPEKEVEDTTTTTTTTVTPVTMPTAEKTVKQQLLEDPLQGFTEAELAIGSENVDWTDAPEERGTAAFSETTLKTPEEVGAFLSGSDPKQVEAGRHVAECIRAEGYGEDEVARAMSGEGYFAVQLLVAAQILGTTHYQDGQIIESGQWREVEHNDVFWFYLTMDGRVLKCATVRADCVNPNILVIRPRREDMPTAIPVDVPPSEVPAYKCPVSGATPDGEGLCPKIQTVNIDRNPNLPAQIGGPGTTPVGTDPGPATPTYDTPCGLAQCPGPVTDGSGTGSNGGGGSSGGGSSEGEGSSTTVPISRGGNTGHSAPPTTAPAEDAPATPPNSGTAPEV